MLLKLTVAAWVLQDVKKKAVIAGVIAMTAFSFFVNYRAVTAHIEVH
jgi:hypothetical protein